MRKTITGLFVLMSLLAFTLAIKSYAEGEAKTGGENTTQFQSIQGQVAGLSMKALEKNLLSPTQGMPGKESKTGVIITLERDLGREYRILLDEMLNIEGFGDLKGKDKMMGGALILSDLQKRLVGKNIVLKCRKIGVEKNKEIFGVSGLEIVNKPQDRSDPGVLTVDIFSFSKRIV